MTETAVAPVESRRRLRLDWVPGMLFFPRQTLAAIMEAHTGIWLTPLLLLTITALLLVGATGSLKAAAAQTGTGALPPGFEYYTPEQQAQYQQAMAATSGPVFIYVFPGLMALAQVWVGWLLVSSIMHLALTLLGWRGDTQTAMNLVAWASLPFAVRDLVRLAAVLSTGQLLSHPGLSGFAPTGEGGLSLYLTGLLALVDVYLLWHTALIILGVRLGRTLPTGKAAAGVLLTLLLVVALQALPGFLAGRLGGMTIIRPFF